MGSLVPLNGIGVDNTFDVNSQSDGNLIMPVNGQTGLLEVVPRATTLSSFSVAATPGGSGPIVLVGVTAVVCAQLSAGSVNAGLLPVAGATCTFTLDDILINSRPYSCTASPSATIPAGKLVAVLYTMSVTSPGQPLNQSVPMYVSAAAVGS